MGKTHGQGQKAVAETRMSVQRRELEKLNDFIKHSGNEWMDWDTTGLIGATRRPGGNNEPDEEE